MVNLKNKKGLSDVITNVLIILLVIIAVGIIAAFVFPLLRGSVEKAGESQQCIGIDLSATKCIYTTNGDRVNVTVSRGAGSYNVGSAVVIFSKGDGTTESESIEDVKIDDLKIEFATIVGEFSALGYEPNGASVAITLEGSSQSCPRTTEISCTKI